MTAAWLGAIRSGRLERTHHEPDDQEWHYKLTAADGHTRSIGTHPNVPEGQGRRQGGGGGVSEIEFRILAVVSSAAWLVRKHHLGLAREMRDEFMREWEVSPKTWNASLDSLIEYVRDANDYAAAVVAQFKALRL